MSQAILGANSKLYYNASGWVLVNNCRDLFSDVNVVEYEATPRGNNSWKGYLSGFTDATINFDMIDDPTDAALTVFNSAFFEGNDVQCAIMDAPIANAGSQGLQGLFIVTKFKRNEPLADVVTVSISLKPSFSGGVDWVTV